jgi:hypothetical protein
MASTKVREKLEFAVILGSSGMRENCKISEMQLAALA